MNYHNTYAKLDPRLYNKQLPTALSNPKAGHFNLQVAQRIGWADDEWLMQNWVEVLSGAVVPQEFEPLSMAYAGHQFGQWAGQLGDGRGLLMAQVLDKHGKLSDLHLKGSGLTPYSRMGDGRAVLRSTIREYLCGHALNRLGIASSDAIGFVVSDTPVRREQIERGAALMRVADSHVRLGHIEWIASYAPDLLAEFTDYMIDTYYPHCKAKPNEQDPVAAFLQSVVKRTAIMIANWQLIGFAHGVMNTDNLSITGSTLDFGPFGFMERFNPAWINNHSDHTGRYSYQNQPAIGHWNLNIWLPHFMRLPNISRSTLAECLAPYENTFMLHYQQGLCQKLGLAFSRDSMAIAFDWLTMLEDHKLDYTNSFRALFALITHKYPQLSQHIYHNSAHSDDVARANVDEENVDRENIDRAKSGINDSHSIDNNALAHDQKMLAMLEEELNKHANTQQLNDWHEWKQRYLAQLDVNDDTSQMQQAAVDNAQPSFITLQTRMTQMRDNNPVYILRNSMAQRAIEKAQDDDFSEVDRLYHLLNNPYHWQSIGITADTTPPKPDAPALPISCSS